MQGKTKTGFAYEVDKKWLEDVRFLRTFAKVSGGDELQVFKLAEMLLGEKQMDALCEHIQDDEGHATADAFADELTDILEALAEDNETKK